MDILTLMMKLISLTHRETQMRRKSVINKIARKLRHWEGSQLTHATANDILKVVESCEPTLRNSWNWSTKKVKKK